MTRIKNLLSIFLVRLKSELGKALIRTFLTRTIVAVGTVFLSVIVGRLYGPMGMGVLALAQSFLLGGGILTKTGMDGALMRFVGQSPESPYVLRYLIWALRKTLPLSLIAALVLWFGRFWFESCFNAPGLADALAGIAVLMPAFTLSLLMAGFFKGGRMPATACLLENGAVALFSGVFILVWVEVGGEPRFSVIGYSYAAAGWFVALQGGGQLWRWCLRQAWWASLDKVETTEKAITLSQFQATSRAFFTINFAGFMQSVLGVMVAGWLLTSAELGLFKSAQQVGLLIAFVLIVVNAIFPPRFAALYHQGNMNALGRLARQGAMLAVIIAAPISLVCLVSPEWVLGWFGKGFEVGAPLLRIVALAQLVNVSTGSVGFLLNMTGHERLMRNIALICNALGLLAFFVLIPLFGALGAALALAFVLVVQNLVALLFVWRRLGIWTLPGPNLLALMGIRSSAGR